MNIPNLHIDQWKGRFVILRPVPLNKLVSLMTRIATPVSLVLVFFSFTVCAAQGALWDSSHATLKSSALGIQEILQALDQCFQNGCGFGSLIVLITPINWPTSIEASSAMLYPPILHFSTS